MWLGISCAHVLDVGGCLFGLVSPLAPTQSSGVVLQRPH